MKVMGSAILVFEAIVLGLSIPISVVIYDVDKTLTLWSTFLLMILCILAVGGVRHDKRAAITTGIVVQAIIIGVGIFVLASFSKALNRLIFNCEATTCFRTLTK